MSRHDVLRELTEYRTEYARVPLEELFDAWRAAQDEAVTAYGDWRWQRDATAYAVYRAAQDRADQAQDALVTPRGQA